MTDRTSIRTKTLTVTNGGLVTVGGERNFLVGETPFMRNWDILNNGGLEKSPGLTEVMELPDEVQDFLIYERKEDDGSAQWDLLAYAFPYVIKIDPYQATQSILKNNLMSTGDPVSIQRGTTMLVVDGANNPFSYTGGTSMPNIVWPPSYSQENATAIPKSVYTRASNPAAADIGYPHDAELYQNRALLIEAHPGRAYLSKAGNILDFSDNADVGGAPPVDIAAFLDLPIATPFTALQKVSDGCILYGPEEMWKLTGENIPLPGLDNTFEFNLINGQVGCLGPKLVQQKDNNDHYFVSRYGVYDLQQAENFNKEKPGGLSFKIYKDLKRLGSGALSRSRLLNVTDRGQLFLITPRVRSHMYPDKIWKLNYSVNPTTPCWSVAEFFGEFPRIDAAIVLPPYNDIFIASSNKIFKMEGTSYFDGAIIQSVYEWPPDDLGFPGKPKGIIDVIINYFSRSGANIFLTTTWSDGTGGTSYINLPSLLSSVAGQASYGSNLTQSHDGYIASAKFNSSTVTTPLTGGIVGDLVKWRLVHNSATEDLIIFSIDVRYRVLV